MECDEQVQVLLSLNKLKLVDVFLIEWLYIDVYVFGKYNIFCPFLSAFFVPSFPHLYGPSTVHLLLNLPL